MGGFLPVTSLLGSDSMENGYQCSLFKIRQVLLIHAAGAWMFRLFKLGFALSLPGLLVWVT